MKLRESGGDSVTFPRWESSLHSAVVDAATTNTTSNSSDLCEGADSHDSHRDAGFCSTVEAVVRVSDSDSPRSFSNVTVSSSDFVVAYHMPLSEDCVPDCERIASDCSCHSVGNNNAAERTAKDFVGAVQNNLPLLNESAGTKSEPPIEDGSPPSAVRDSSPPTHRRRPGFSSNTSNAAKEKGATSEKPQQDHEEGGCCLAEYTPLRCLALIVYYLILWAVTIVLTYGLLELSLIVTSRGKFPYYMSAHSFFLTSPRVAFTVGNPELGKVSEYAGLSALRDKLTGELRRVGEATGGWSETLRSCDSPNDITTEESALMRPCNMTLFVALATAKVTALLKDRPAALVQIRRHIGYLPAKGPWLKITCTCKAGDKILALRYHNWNGTDIAESTSGGHVMDTYFPMLTRRHYAPSVIVAVDTAVDDADWIDKKLVLRCTASDGGPEARPERELIMKVKVKG